jgi:predicted GIY-YIG superfamily endonuclease
MSWWVYLLECGDGTLYTGITNDVERRLRLHAAGKGARYTRGRGPFRLLWTEEWPDRSAASRREREVKGLTRQAKLRLAMAVVGTDPCGE